MIISATNLCVGCIAAGSPGPFESIKPSGLYANISSNVAVIGKTMTSHPLSFRQRVIFRFTPKSRSATFKSEEPEVDLDSYATFVETLLESSSPSIEGTDFTSFKS